MHVIKAAGSESAFARALRSYQTGGITLDDFLGQIDRWLASGASVAELLEWLRQREQVEPLSAAVHSLVRARIEARPAEARPAETPPEEARPAEEAAAEAWLAEALPENTQPSSMPALNAEAATVVLGEEGAERLAWLPEPSDVNFFGGRYRLIEMIADGAMSRVYKAEDVSADNEARRLVAIKVFKRPLGDDGRTMAAVETEFARLRALSHPNIVQLFECGRVASTLYTSMEYLTGETLWERMHPAPHPDARPMAGAQVQEIVVGVANALDHAHGHQVVHGDLKPGNVLLTAAGIKVIDFGMSSWPGTALTPRYASPQLLARQPATPADDVYSLACVAYEALSGRHPFVSADGVETTTRAAPPQRPEFTPAQYTALVRALSADRAERTQTALEFLRQFAKVEPAAAATAGGRKGWLALAALAALALLTLGWWALRPMPTKPLTAHVAPAPVVPAENSAVPPPPVEAHKTLRDCATCPVMILIPPGRFRQGVPEEDRNGLAAERPDHVVVLAHSLAVAADDVTVGEFAAFVAATHREVRGCDVYDGEWRRRNGASYKEPGYPQTDEHPVTCVSWNDALAYTQWLSSQSGQAYRLPSAAEWEYAARGGGSAPMPWDAGGANACANANVADESAGQRYPGWTTFACKDGFVYTSPVGSFPANGYGLRDMLGNVLQWTQDCWHADYTGAPLDGAARLDGDCRDRELRGGSWFSAPTVVRASHRNHFAAGYRTSSVGFRVVRNVEP